MHDCSDDYVLLLGVVDRVQTVRFSLVIKRTSMTSKTFGRTLIKESIAKDLPCCPIHDAHKNTYACVFLATYGRIS